MTVWISVFRRKKRFENPIIGCRDIKQKPSLIFFGTPCRLVKKNIGKFNNRKSDIWEKENKENWKLGKRK